VQISSRNRPSDYQIHRIGIIGGNGWSDPVVSVLTRHAKYAQKLNLKSDKSAILTLYIPSDSPISKIEPFLDVCTYKSHFPAKLDFLNFAISKHISNFKTITFSDPFLYPVFYFFLLKKHRRNAVIQIQCHGDFGDANWSKNNLKNWIFSKLAGITLIRANQVRCVSKSQAKKIISAYKIDPAKIVIAPIPTKDKEDLPLWVKPTIPIVGFLGRLHKERAVDLWVKTAQEIFSVRNDVHFLIIGDGPERENFQSGLNNIPANQVSFVGKLPNEEALELIAKSSLLLSTAPFESFGMAMVETAKIGLPIVSKPTSGALDLSEGYDSISLGNTPKELAGLALAALNRETPGVISDSLFLQSENETVDAIVDAWIKLL
jgi:glycosyltransferase involved in cell wall biosynthesis